MIHKMSIRKNKGHEASGKETAQSGKEAAQNLISFN